MELKHIQIKQNGAKEDSQREKKWVLSSWRFLKIPGAAPVSSRSYSWIICMKGTFSVIYMRFATLKYMRTLS